MTGGNVTKFILFTQDQCYACGAVRRYIKNNKENIVVEEVEWQKQPEMAERYNINCAPVLIVVDEYTGELVDSNGNGPNGEYMGAGPIIKNISKLWSQYGKQEN